MKTVLIALAAGLMVFEFTSASRAALGWTLDQCKSHFGSEPFHRISMETRYGRC
jgi:hypothetical protein